MLQVGDERHAPNKSFELIAGRPPDTGGEGAERRAKAEVDVVAAELYVRII
jgi:hypothetical protein